MKLSAAMVLYDNEWDEVRAALDSLRSQTRVPDEIVVVDNSSEGRYLRPLSGEPLVKAITTRENTGYTGGARRAAEMATGEILLFVNPDSQLEPECVEHLEAALLSADDVALAGAQILLPDGLVNAGENPVHVSGLSWCGRLGEAREDGAPREVLSISGCVLMTRAETFAELDGFCERFFMYFDDTDYCWRARLAGKRILFCPRARAIHNYSDKGMHSWLWIERNRLWMILSNFEASTLIRLLPVLLLVEAALWASALAGGWAGYKLRSYLQILGGLPWLWRRRRQVQTTRSRGDAALLGEFTWRLWVAQRPPLLNAFNALLRSYGRLAGFPIR